ncbi:MAG: M20/M25/M40 family metallo-hydrolase, partial [Chloroflexota bacterium]
VAAQKRGVTQCADLVAAMFLKRDFTVEIMDTGGAPVVYAERKGKSDKTLIFYNHYDVQPEDPIDLWDSEPFKLAQKDGKLFARGISDDKGHLVSRLFALDALLADNDELPCNLKFLIEGEEEIGSINLPPFLKENAEKFAADACIWEFGGVDFRDHPMQYLGMRGICYVELSVETASIDAHSGIGGTIFPNAAWRLVWALSTLKDQNEKILIPGHYDNVVPPTARDRELFDALPDRAAEYKSRYNIKKFIKGVTGGTDLAIQEVFEPSCTIAGITTGYQGPGTKTVLPATASAIVDFRLVPNQTPEEIMEKLRAHLDAQGFEDVKVVLNGGEAPGRTDPDDPFIQTVIDAAVDAYGMPQEIVPMVGGSG